MIFTNLPKFFTCTRMSNNSGSEFSEFSLRSRSVIIKLHQSPMGIVYRLTVLTSYILQFRVLKKPSTTKWSERKLQRCWNSAYERPLTVLPQVLGVTNPYINRYIFCLHLQMQWLIHLQPRAWVIPESHRCPLHTLRWGTTAEIHTKQDSCRFVEGFVIISYCALAEVQISTLFDSLLNCCPSVLAFHLWLSVEDIEDSCNECVCGGFRPGCPIHYDFLSPKAVKLYIVSLQQNDADQVPSRPSFVVVVAIDFGTTSSGYAYAFTKEPECIHTMR